MAQNARAARRAFLQRAAFSTALLGLPALAPTFARAASQPFSIVVLPDTQFYVRYDGPSNRPGIYTSQIDWILERLATENIVFVSHVGDVVNNGAAQPIEWERANAAMDRLHGRVPYSVVPGNHDLNRVGSRSSGMSIFAQHYGRSRYQGMNWYGGCSENQANHFQVFGAGAWTFLHLGLELEAPDSALEWAKAILESHPGMPTIITTHAYQNDSSGRTTRSEFQGNSGEQIWQKLIKVHSQIFMVLNGHFYAKDGERHQISYNVQGQPVFEMESDYQHYPDGGQGYLRIIRFDPAASAISVRSYSPWLNTFMTDSDSQFSFSIDLAKRFGSTVSPTTMPSPTSSATPAPSPTPPPAAGEPNTKVFLPIADAAVYASAPNSNYGSNIDLNINGGSNPARHGYLRFDVRGITTTVRRAVVRLFVPANGTSNGPLLYATGANWAERTITWATRPAAVGAALANSAKLAPATWAEYDVTSAVRGDSVYEFVLVAESADGVSFSSREGEQKPELVITL